MRDGSARGRGCRRGAGVGWKKEEVGGGGEREEGGAVGRGKGEEEDWKRWCEEDGLCGGREGGGEDASWEDGEGRS